MLPRVNTGATITELRQFSARVPTRNRAERPIPKTWVEVTAELEKLGPDARPARFRDVAVASRRKYRGSVLDV